MSAKFTPGPWGAFEATEDCPLPGGVPVSVGKSPLRVDLVCNLCAQGDGKYEPVVVQANARLIASAPDMYALLKRWRDTTPHGYLRNDTKALLAHINGDDACPPPTASTARP